MFSKHYEQSFKSKFQSIIDTFGRDISINYHSTSQCTACSVNPLTGESMDSNCSSCNGTGLVYSNKTLVIRGVTKNFLGNQSFFELIRGKVDWMPIGDGRITCELEPLLKDINNPEGDTILKEVDFINYMGETYKVKNEGRVNLGDFYIAVITLEKYSGRDVKL